MLTSTTPFAAVARLARTWGVFHLLRTLALTPLSAPYLLTEGRDTFKDVFSRKTFLIDYYKHLNDTNNIVLYCHHNNLNKVDNARVRLELNAAGAKLVYLRNSLYKAYLRSADQADPALKLAREATMDVVHPLAPLLKGPTAVIAINDTDPLVVKAVLKTLKLVNEKLFVIGAQVETSVYDAAQVDQFKDLPTKQQLQGQLAGLLTVLGGAGLVRTLELASTHLYLTLDTRKDDMAKQQGGDAAKEAE